MINQKTLLYELLIYELLIWIFFRDYIWFYHFLAKRTVTYMYSYGDNTGASESFSSRTSGNELIILGLFSIERFIQKFKFAKRIFLVQFPWLLIISLTKFRRSPKRILKHFEFFVCRRMQECFCKCSWFCC